MPARQKFFIGYLQNPFFVRNLGGPVRQKFSLKFGQQFGENLGGPARLKLIFSLIVAFSAIFLFLPGSVFAQVVINEFLPNPASGENEWVELYNTGGSEVSFAGWILTDAVNNNKTLDHLGQIVVGGFVVYEYPSGDGWLNNPGDTVFLKNGATTIDSFTYSSDPGEGITIGRLPDGTGDWQILSSATRGAPNSSPTFSPTPTPIPTPTPTSSPATGTYKINDAKDEEGSILSNVKIYVDDEYTHHYVSETLTFGEGRYCDDDKEVECGFGEHTIRLEKDNYEDWEETITINSGFYKEVSPVMISLDISASPTSTPTPTSKPTTPSPTKKPTPTPTPTPTPSGEILGEEATPGAEVISFNVSEEATPRSFNPQKFLPFIFIGLGILFLAIAGGSVLLPQIKKKYNIRRSGKVEEII